MSLRRKRLLVVLLCAVGLIVAALVLRFWFVGPARYRQTFLTTAAGEPIIPVSINDRGQIVGLAQVKGGEYRIFLWDKEHGAQDLGSFDEPGHVGPLRINNVGQITGGVRDANGCFRAFIRGLDGEEHLLDVQGGKFSMALGLSNRGQVVGLCGTGTGPKRAVVWDGTAGVTDLGTLGGPRSLGGGINDEGQVAGFSQTASGRWHAFFWDPNTGMKDLGPTSFTPGGEDYILVNNNGLVVGRFGSASDQMLISTWCEGKGVQAMPSMRGIDAHPTALNDANQFLVHVRSAMRIGGVRLFHHVEDYLWDPDEGYISFKSSLGRRDVRMFHPRDINNRGQIVGHLMLKKSEQPHGVLLEPIE